MSATILSPSSPVSVLAGVGKSRENALAALGIFTLRDLVYHFPRAYQHRGNVLAISDANGDVPCSLLLTVASEPLVRLIKRGMSLLKFRAFDDSGSLTVTYFNQDYLKSTFRTGMTFRFFGKIKREYGGVNLASPQYEPYSEDVPLPEFVSVYPLSAPLSQKMMTAYINAALKLILPLLEDTLPENVREENNLCTLRFALGNIHAPKNRDDLDKAVRRLAFDELFSFALSLARKNNAAHRELAPRMSDVSVDAFLRVLPYSLTPSQLSAVREICSDMGGESHKSGNNTATQKLSAKKTTVVEMTEAMNRVLIGDVGCGKTVCAAAAVYVAVKNGYRAAIMAPTEILASQHYADLQPLFSRLGINAALLTGSSNVKTRRAIADGLSDIQQNLQRIDVVIGTHALIEDSVRIDCLGIVVIDEQHRFGVAQREALMNKAAGLYKGEKTTAHTLSMSATPIPRTLSLVIFGDADVSRITDMPPGRQKVDTFSVDGGYRERLNAFIRKQCAAENQVYIVCPAVEEAKSAETETDENFGDISLSFGISNGNFTTDTASFDEYAAENSPPLKAAVDFAAELAKTFPEYEVGFIHGKLSGAEKNRIMERFCSGQMDILVSTTVIEVGVNVPNATLMIVENAERFGLSQLHQLRGRVGRGASKSYCVLVSDSRSETAKSRLKTLCGTNDGFEIAEKDLAMRGPGDILSSTAELKQHGDLHFRLAGSCTDTALIEAAFSAARRAVL